MLTEYLGNLRILGIPQGPMALAILRVNIRAMGEQYFWHFGIFRYTGNRTHRHHMKRSQTCGHRYRPEEGFETLSLAE